jgi:hypothetical protein
MKETFAANVRMAAKTIQKENGHVTVDMLQTACAISTRKEQERLYDTIGDFCKRGELHRVKKGVYLYAGKQTVSQKQQVMWRYLRSSKSFGGVKLAELQEVAGASTEYAGEWLEALVARGVAKKIQGSPTRWQLLHDPVEMPQNEAKAERLRAIRAKKRKAVLDGLSRAKNAISRAESFILEEGQEP